MKLPTCWRFNLFPFQLCMISENSAHRQGSHGRVFADVFLPVLHFRLIPRYVRVPVVLCSSSWSGNVSTHCIISDVISGMMPILLSLSWVFTVAITVKNIVWEKESRQKELMKMMGLSGT